MSSFGVIRITLSMVFLILFYRSWRCNARRDDQLCSGQCGIHKISHPFRLQESPDECGDMRYNLSCENNQLILYLGLGKYYVKSINYNNYTIRLVDVNLTLRNFSSSSLPPYSLGLFNFSDDAMPYQAYQGWTLFGYERLPYKNRLANYVLYLRCPNGVDDGNINTVSCINSSYALGSTTFYVKINDGMSLWDLALGDSCRVESIYLTSWPAETKPSNLSSCRDIHDVLLYGFELSWLKLFCQSWVIRFNHHDNNNTRCEPPGLKVLGNFLMILSLIILVTLSCVAMCCARCVVGVTGIVALFIFKWRRRHLSMYYTIENFLRSDNNIIPLRYSYKDIKKITEQFKTKLGNGGYGSVFKGKLKSGRIVAVKILDKAKANGQDFINEVATIGRIHHVNVVQLIGFCIEGSKRALVYEFMSNGSLEKIIFSHEEDSSLSCEKLYTIALGVTRGIEYLHNGCNMKILHFDIKPHNILLDEDFNPKVSDFGLARLCPIDNSIVSLTAARGTIGYMAPELFYRNVGTVSYKADVYSFGMLLMEMASKRKNLNALAENSSQIYFPLWVYDRLYNGREIITEDDTEEDMKLTKKMMIVALWCIQTRPVDRPSMDRVLEMLEKDEELQMPSKPYLYLQDPSIEDARDHISPGPSSDMSASDSKKSI